jgi:hypothetical protein
MIILKTWIRHPDGEPDLTCPVITCDHCSQQITAAAPGNLLWHPDDEGASATLFQVHKKCDRSFSAGKPHFYSRELEEFLAQLATNYHEPPIPAP